MLASPLDISPKGPQAMAAPLISLACPLSATPSVSDFDVTSWCGTFFSGFCAHINVLHPALRLPGSSVCCLGPNISRTDGEIEASDC